MQKKLTKTVLVPSILNLYLQIIKFYGLASIKKYSLLLIFMLFYQAMGWKYSGEAVCQTVDEITEAEESFFFDAVVFKGSEKSEARVDVYTLVPGKTLSFVSSNGGYAAYYTVNITIYDSSNAKFKEEEFKRKMTAADYAASQGSTGLYDNSQRIFFLPPGRFRVKVTLTDTYSKMEYVKTRVINVLDFDDYPFSLSGILLVSSIEESGGSYVITPHLSDNVGNLKEGFFAFFETYDKVGYDSVDFVYEIMSGNGDIEAKGKRVRKSLRKQDKPPDPHSKEDGDTLSSTSTENTDRQSSGGSVTQQFIRIAKPESVASGTYTLQVIALKPSDTAEYDIRDYIAVAQRSIRFAMTLGSFVVSDINASIRQLRYVATASESDYIEEGATNDEKLRRFEDFWEKKDPTPNTDRNEAFDEYYQRIEYANKNFRSYSDGWLTDMGMVYIIFGQPYSTDRSTGYYSDGRVYMRWVYRNNKEFIFVDNSGVGDYRLVRPVVVTEKYRYGSN